MFTYYRIWWRMRSGQLAITRYGVKARTDKEAQSKTMRKMRYYGFAPMDFIAAPFNKPPNVKLSAGKRREEKI